MSQVLSNVYRQKVSEFEKRIDSFRILPCNISRIIEDVISVKNSMKDADDFYMNMSEDLKEQEISTFQKSNELVRKYNMIMRNIGKVCECKPSKP